MPHNIILMHHAMELTERIREAAEAQAEAVRAKRAAQCNNICQAIAAVMFDDEYQAWIEATPTVGFYSAAVDKLIALMQSEPEGTEASPYILGGEIFDPSFVTANDADMPF